MNTTTTRITCAASAVAAFLVFSSITRAATIVPVVTLTAYDNAPISGNADNHNASGDNVSAGELDDSSINRLERATMVFSMPTLAVGETVVSATLNIYVRTVTNGSGSLPDAVLYDSQTQNRTTNNTTFYEDASYTSTGLSVANASMTASSSAPVLVSLDVTSWVNSDYQLDGSSVVSSFRIQVDGQGFVDDDKSNRYTFFGMNSTSYAPQLVLTTTTSAIPEPGTFAMLAGGVGMMVAVGSRRRAFKR